MPKRSEQLDASKYEGNELVDDAATYLRQQRIPICSAVSEHGSPECAFLTLEHSRLRIFMASLVGPMDLNEIQRQAVAEGWGVMEMRVVVSCRECKRARSMSGYGSWESLERLLWRSLALSGDAGTFTSLRMEITRR